VLEWTVIESAITEGFSELSLSVDEDTLFPSFFISVLVTFSFFLGGIGNK